MPPMNTIVVHTVLLPPERRDETVLGQAQRLLTNALKPVNENLEGKDYLIGDFSGADIMLGHSCFMSNRLGCVSDEMSNIKAYVEKLEARPAFKKAIAPSAIFDPISFILSVPSSLEDIQRVFHPAKTIAIRPEPIINI